MNQGARAFDWKEEQLRNLVTLVNLDNWIS